MKKTLRPAIFKWRQTEPEVILLPCAGTFGTRSRSAMSEALLTERGVAADQTKILALGPTLRS